MLGAARPGAARRRRVAALGQPAGAGRAVPRDGGAQGARRTSRPPAAGCASCRARWKQVALAPRAQGEAMWRRFKTAQDEVFARTAGALRRAERGARGEPGAQAGALRARRGAGRFDRLGEDRRRDPGAAGGVEDDRPGQPRPREGDLGAVPRARAIASSRRRQEDLKHRKEDWAANLARKEALCEKAEALAESTEWDAAAAQLKQLQAEWKTIGPVRKSKSEAVWQRFRAACDRFFDRYKHRDQVELQEKAAARDDGDPRARGAGCRPTGADADAAPDESVRRPCRRRAPRWQQAPELPRALQQDLAARYHQALGRLVAAWPAAFAGTDLDPEPRASGWRSWSRASRSWSPEKGAPQAGRCRRRSCSRSSGASGSPPTR